MTTDTGEELSSLSQFFVSRGQEKGRAEGEAHAVLTVLAARGITVPEERRAEILGCSDLVMLDGWVARAATATSVEDLFGGAPES